ncbi:glycoside hydrolase domain-containing protein [Agromyces laixinhei]|uniref:glycoside hydrolase domain-containing protein n=1 Tax=Agromyces laixinhei TaxID=2585717 RepID=UPI0018DD3850|nr:glycoside hydrolase domain-containing protein [Agromyces laixinhei]
MLHRPALAVAASLSLVAGLLVVGSPATAAPVQATTETPSAASSALSAAPADGLDPGLELADIASRGEGDWLRYRIPSLTSAPNGDLLAIFDGRPTMNDLPSNIALLMRRSTDGGATWQEQQVIRQDAAPNGYGDPSVVVDRETDDIFVFYAASINAGFASSTTGSDPNDPNVLHADYSVSRDDGATWEHHRITRELKGDRTNWAGMFAASGEGIQLRTGEHAGRLIQQYTVRIGGANFAVSAYSDDHGETWNTSEPVGPGADENKVAELADGSVLLVSRAAPYRLTAKSTDGGETYSAFTQDRELPDPANNGSVIRAFPDAPADDPRAQILLHSNTANQNVRRNLTVRMSCDSGATWPVEKVVQSGASAYSTLTPLPGDDGELGGSYGLLYEREGYRHISYTSFDFDWLGGACASLSVATPPTFTAGQQATVQVTVANQSGAELPAAAIALSDDSTWSGAGVEVPALAAGESATVAVPLTPPATADTRTHTVRLEYRAASGTSFVDAALSVQASGLVPAPSLELRPVLDAIYTGGADGLIGDRIQPWLEVVNTGNVTLTNIRLVEPAGGAACNFSSLAPGVSYVCRNNSPNHTITAADMGAGAWSTNYRATAQAAGRTIEANARLFPVDLTEGLVEEGGASVTVPSGEFATSSFARVPRVGAAGTAAGADQPLTLQVPSNGRASAQLAVTAGDDVDDLAVTVSTLTEVGEGGSASIDGAVTVRYPEYIENQVEGGLIADPLQEVGSVDVPAGRNQPVWFTVEVPTGTEPGVYEADVAVSSAAGAIAERTLRVVVPETALRPVADRPFVLDLWSHPDAVADQLGLEPWSEEHFAALEPYWEDLAAAGQDVVNLAITEDPWLVEHEGQIRAQTWSPYRSTVDWTWDGTEFGFDFAVFDRLVTDARAAGVGNDIHVFAMLQFRNYDRITYTDTRTGERVDETVVVGDARYNEAWEAFLTAFTEHLQAKGWFDDTRLAFDEQPLARMNAAFAVLDTVSPEWRDKIALAANSLAEADIAEAISFNVSFLDDVPQSLIDERRAADKPTLFYTWNEPTVPNTVVPTPPYNTRTLGWVVEQRDLDGYLRWTYNSWPEDVYADPSFRYGQGDEYIIYPGEDGPVSSTRWELFRDGQDDAELLDIAKAELGSDHPVVAAALAGIDPAGASTPAAWATMLDHRAALIAALSNADGADVDASIEGGVVAAGGVATFDVTVTAGTEPLTGVTVDVPGATSVTSHQGDEPIAAGTTGTWTVTTPVSGAPGERFTADVVVSADGDRVIEAVTVRAGIVDAVAPLAPIELDRISVASPLDTITASIPVRNLGAEARTVTLAATGLATFAGAPVSVAVAPGDTQVVELVLDPQGRSGLDELHLELSTDDGAVLASNDVSLVAGGYFLSDAELTQATNGWGPVEIDRSNGEDAAGDGAAISLGGKQYPKGFGAHAASTISLELGGKCNAVSFDYGIDDEIAAGGSILFLVRGDDSELWRSPAVMTAASATGSAVVDVTGVDRLDLVLDPQGGVGQDHGDWANIWAKCEVAAPQVQFDAVAETRCVGSKAYVTVKATNRETVPISLLVSSTYGEKSFASVSAGKNAVHSFTARASSVPDGTVTFEASATVNGADATTTLTADYEARSCG